MREHRLHFNVLAGMRGTKGVRVLMSASGGQCFGVELGNMMTKPSDSTETMPATAVKAPAHAQVSATISTAALPENAGMGRENAPANQAGGNIFSPESLLLIMAGKPENRPLMMGLVRKMVEQGDAPLREVRAAYADGRMKDAGRMLHTMRGSMGMFGATRFVNAALQAEAAVGKDSAEAFEASFSAVERELALLCQTASAWLETV